MRSLALVLLTGITTACTSSPSATGSPADGGQWCPVPLNDCTHPNVGFLPSDADYCTLPAAIAAACQPGGLPRGLTQGSTYAYLDFVNVDVGARFVYDATGALVAVLWFSANTQPSWSCLEGPALFDPREATSLLIASSSAQTTLAERCGG